MIMAARVQAGWIKAEDLITATEETDGSEGGEDAAAQG
jgi:hypothetical protein